MAATSGVTLVPQPMIGAAPGDGLRFRYSRRCGTTSPPLPARKTATVSAIVRRADSRTGSGIDGYVVSLINRATARVAPSLLMAALSVGTPAGRARGRRRRG